MSPRMVCLVFLLALACCPQAHAKDPAPGAHPAPPKPTDIDLAIERGVEWLLKEQRPRGTWGSRSKPLGPTTLAVHALLHAGVREDDGTPPGKRLARALRFLDRSGPGRAKPDDRKVGTYELSLMLLLLRSRGRPEDRERMQRLADRLVQRQSQNGQWWYLPDGRKRPATGDNSNAQFAILALGAAVGEGLRVSPDALRLARAWWRSAAQPDGGFGYASGGSQRSASTGSMTAAGVACLAILDAALGTRAEPESGGEAGRETKRDAAATFLGSIFSVKRNHGPAKGQAGQRQKNAGRGWLHYYLWTVERAMVLHGSERLGTTDWFAEGTRHLLKTQNKDGSWRQEMPIFATSFALLFLTRAADPPRAFTPHPARPSPPGRPAPITGEGPAKEPGAPVGEAEPAASSPKPPKRPDGSVSQWIHEALAPGVLAERCRQTGPSTLRPLVRALRERDPLVRQRAFEALRALLPDERTARADRHPLPRGRLELWVALHARDLRLIDGRFCEVP